MVRIAHFIDTKCKGGAEVTLMDLCAFQRSKGFEISVFHPDNHFLREQCERFAIRSLPIPAYKYYKSTLKLPLYTIAMLLTLRRLGIDILHSHLFGPVTGNALATRLAGTRHIGTIHDVYTIQEKPARSMLLKFSHYMGTRLVCVSDDMTRFYNQHLSLKPGMIHTIYNAVSPPIPLTEERQQLVRQQYNLNEQSIVISTVGRLVGLKRIDWLIRALAAIVERGNDNVKLLVIGSGPESESLQRLSHSLGIQGHVIFTGEVSDVNPILAVTHVYTQFSRTEGLSRSIIEAISWGLPCVVSDVGGNRELVLHEKSGYVLPVNDMDSLVQHLEYLVNNKQVREIYSANAKAHCAQQFNAGVFQQSYLDLYGIPDT